MDPPGKSKYVHTSRSASDAKIALSGAEISMQNTHPCHQRPTRSARLHTYLSTNLRHGSGLWLACWVSMSIGHECMQVGNNSWRGTTARAFFVHVPMLSWGPVFTLCISLLLLHESGVRASTISADPFRVALIGRITQKGECDGRT